MSPALRSRYVVDERLGEGATGVVYRVSRPDTPDRAMKALRPELAEDPQVRARFTRGRRQMRALRGPHLVAVEDLVVDHETVGIVMELVGGGTLRAYSRAHGAVPASVALPIARQNPAGPVGAAPSRAGPPLSEP